MKTLLCLCLFLAAALTMSAADISGKWSGTFTATNPGGEEHTENAYVTLQQKGTELTGSAGPDESRTWPLKGKVEGDRITFEVQADDALYKGDLKLVGDHLKGEITASKDGETMKAKMDLTKAK